MRTCFIACDHGLGHTRRVVAVCRELQRITGLTPTVFADADYGRRFGWETVHFRTRTSRIALIKGDDTACHWHERLPDLRGFDIVVSDNLPEVLELRNDALLMGSFLWHQVVEDIDRAYRSNADRLLERYRPIMIGSSLFASPEVHASTRFKDVGLFQAHALPDNRRTDLLISCGLTDECVEEVEAAVSGVLDASVIPFEQVYVEPRLMPKNPPAWMVPADFGPEMYSRVAAAVLRPGVGTTTELLHVGAKVYCFYEGGNRELLHNAQRLAEHGYGVDCCSGSAAVAAALAEGDRLIGDREPYVELSFDGAVRAAEYIASLRPADGDK